MKCIVCHHNSCSFWFKHEKNFDIFLCDKCGSGFVYPPPSLEFLENFYHSQENSMTDPLENVSAVENYKSVLLEEEEYPNSTLDARSMLSEIKTLTKNTKFLDVGAGYGWFTREALQANFECTALEPNEKTREIFRLMNNFNPLPSLLDQSFAKKNADSFDVVLLSQVVEHLPLDTNPIALINNVLTKNGICAVAVPRFRSLVSIIQGKKDMFITPPEHLNFFTVKGLVELFENNGFELIKASTISRFDKNKLRSKFGTLYLIPWLILRGFLKVSDWLTRGIIINAYFRKISEIKLD